MFGTQKQRFYSMLEDPSGATTVEYGIIIALIASVLLVSVATVESNLTGVLETISSALR